MAALPIYAYRTAPEGLLTRRQLRARGLRPGGADPVAELRWRSGKAHASGGWRTALLYDTARALPVRPMTPGRWRAHRAMMRARRTCPACCTLRPYVISVRHGMCAACMPGAAHAA